MKLFLCGACFCPLEFTAKGGHLGAGRFRRRLTCHQTSGISELAKRPRSSQDTGDQADVWLQRVRADGTGVTEDERFAAEATELFPVETGPFARRKDSLEQLGLKSNLGGTAPLAIDVILSVRSHCLLVVACKRYILVKPTSCVWHSHITVSAIAAGPAGGFKEAGAHHCGGRTAIL
jgi:hypothetical protein